MLVKNFMKRVVTITPLASLQSAAQLMLQFDVTCLAVVGGDGKIVGLVTDGDLFRLVAGSRPVRPFSQASSAEQYEAETQSFQKAWIVQDVMSNEIVTVSPNSEAREVAAIMFARKVKHLPVLDHDILVGVVGRCDLLGEIVDAPLNLMTSNDETSFRSLNIAIRIFRSNNIIGAELQNFPAGQPGKKALA